MASGILKGIAVYAAIGGLFLISLILPQGRSNRDRDD